MIFIGRTRWRYYRIARYIAYSVSQWYAPKINWHGLGIMGSSEEIDVWAEEEKSEKRTRINLDSAILNGGLDSLYLEMLTLVEELQVGKFPDPEPRRLHKAAVNHQRPVFFAEPDMDDELWAEYLGREAKAMTNRGNYFE